MKVLNCKRGMYRMLSGGGRCTRLAPSLSFGIARVKVSQVDLDHRVIPCI